jgi:hypothetical protein
VERPRAAADRLFRILTLFTLLLSIPVCAHAEWPFQDWLQRFIRYWELPSPTESALAPEIASLPPIPDLLRDLESRSAAKRTTASTDLAILCRTGHQDDVIQAFSKELARRPEPEILLSSYYFKVLDPAEERRAQAAFQQSQ